MRIKFVLPTLFVLALSLVFAFGCSNETPIVGLDALSTFSVTQINGGNVTCAELLAGQTIPAGTVCFEVVGNTMNVTYTTTDGWELTEAHLWAGCSVTGYPQTRTGNPKIGNFPYNSGDITGQTAYEFMVDLAQFPCLGTIDCENGNVLYAMAHAALRKDNGDGTYQTETGWGDGGDAPGANWATIVTITLKDDSCGGGGGDDCWGGAETAFGFGGSSATCFSAFPDALDNPNRWGWTNGPYAPNSGTQTFDVYAGAGQCDLSKGTLIGTATLVYDGSTATVTYNLNADWIMTEGHVYVGCDVLQPDQCHGQETPPCYTTAPGQYLFNSGVLSVGSETHTYTATINGLTGCDVYAVIHAAVLTRGPCPE